MISRRALTLLSITASLLLVSCQGNASSTSQGDSSSVPWTLFPSSSSSTTVSSGGDSVSSSTASTAPVVNGTTAGKIAVLSSPRVYPGKRIGTDHLTPSVADTDIQRDAFRIQRDVSGSAIEISESVFTHWLDHYDQAGLTALVINGDLTAGGDTNSHQAVASALSDFQSKNPDTAVVVLPGDSDIDNPYSANYRNSRPLDSVSADGFENQYGAYLKGNPNIVSRYKDSYYFTDSKTGLGMLSYVYRLPGKDSNSPGISLFALDNASHGQWNFSLSDALAGKASGAKMDDELLNWTVDELGKAKARGDGVIVVSPHAIVPSYQGEPQADNGALVENWETVAGLLADNGAGFAFTSGIDATDISGYQTKSKNRIYDIESPSLVSFPGTATVADVSVTADGGSIATDVKVKRDSLTKSELRADPIVYWDPSSGDEKTIPTYLDEDKTKVDPDQPYDVSEWLEGQRLVTDSIAYSTAYRAQAALKHAMGNSTVLDYLNGLNLGPSDVADFYADALSHDPLMVTVPSLSPSDPTDAFDLSISYAGDSFVVKVSSASAGVTIGSTQIGPIRGTLYVTRENLIRLLTDWGEEAQTAIVMDKETAVSESPWAGLGQAIAKWILPLTLNAKAENVELKMTVADYLNALSQVHREGDESDTDIELDAAVSQGLPTQIVLNAFNEEIGKGRASENLYGLTGLYRTIQTHGNDFLVPFLREFSVSDAFLDGLIFDPADADSKANYETLIEGFRKANENPSAKAFLAGAFAAVFSAAFGLSVSNSSAGIRNGVTVLTEAISKGAKTIISDETDDSNLGISSDVDASLSVSVSR